MANNIVVVQVSQQIAPTPNVLQKTGALLSAGATKTAPTTLSLLTQLSDLTPLLRTPLAFTSLTWAAGVATATTAIPHGFTIGLVVPITIAGAVPTAWNGTAVATMTGANTFTFPNATNPGLNTTPGTYVPLAVAELLAMATTFFAQGAVQAVYVFELGAGTAAQGVTALNTWITGNPNVIYSWLVPRNWAIEPSFLAMLAQYEAPTAKTYFFVTMDNTNYTTFTALEKCVFGLIEAPGIPPTEFSAAGPFQHSLQYDPSNTNRVTPFSFQFLFGVTPYPLMGNGPLFSAWKAAAVNWVGTGAEGGISNTILFWGTMLDGNDFTYWYSVDWVQLNSDLNLSNCIINGSNNPQNPLYYDQDGINRLQANEANTMASGISFGLVLGDIVQTALDTREFLLALDRGTYAGKTIINAVPFLPYSKANPGDYKIGKYSGLSVAYVPKRGFTQIVFNLLVSQFVVS